MNQPGRNPVIALEKGLNCVTIGLTSSELFLDSDRVNRPV